MRPRLFLSHRHLLSAALLATSMLAFAAPAEAAAPGGLRDFRLPPAQDAPAAEPAQGPVAPDVPASTRVQQQPAPTPTPTPTATPREVPPRESIPAPAASAVVQPQPSASATPRVIPPRAAPTPLVVQPGAAPAPAAVDDGNTAPAPSASSATPSPLPLPVLPSSVEETPESGTPWFWIAGALLALAAAALAFRLLRRRRPVRTPSVTPVERPSPVPAQPSARGTEPEPTAPASDAEPAPKSGLDVELEPLRLSLTLMNATLSYRLLLNNRGAEPIENLAIAADMIAAHASLSREQQLSGPDADALQVACIERLEPGESRIVSGEFRLPFTQIMPVRQGNAALLFPLARFRIEGAEGLPVTRTFLVAQPSDRPGAGLQPFRLDLGPRIYPRLAQRAFA